ncbi:bifunctional ADP-dependent NAD(P)H-hydrate dehydratase/NAD(P)H-hydrate epimerase [Veronia nyctiphanis]|uniref:Bifunctional NAD(P)H-hydrate repair enzyme n=1 Tax=Veronia nyctiphanis TaxID=1278244 RepID=A0A4Q0YQI7_9GAMM|nr:bifunctional ADP-dependent NAD(P)H-hydrate dehydratase/NAD(P)H-hydrate epimerase [Veronia nyctiphanis]
MDKSLPHLLYTADQVRQGERIIASELGVDLYDLMERAGKAAFSTLIEYWPNASRIAIICGSGNNAGDGYVIGRLALEAGLSVSVTALTSPQSLSGDAKRAFDNFYHAGGRVTDSISVTDVDVAVDAILGTGANRALQGAYLDAVECLNASSVPVMSVDIPSGLHADTGAVLGNAVEAAVTVSFIALKQGMFTGKARQHIVEVLFVGLGLDESFQARFSPSAKRLAILGHVPAYPRRRAAAHKGHFRRVLCVGGHSGMGGAIILAGQATLRAGAALVSLCTQAEHITAALIRQPELMTMPYAECEDGSNLITSFEWAEVIAIGPGLGQSDWSRILFKNALMNSSPMVVDADALNLLAEKPIRRENWILTPHPGEAARLLKKSSAEIEQDRFSAVRELQSYFGGVVVLKGAGTIVYDGQQMAIIDAGNPGMASAGMGDVLTGVIAACLAQSLPMYHAACLGAFIHSHAADMAAAGGERGLLASDLLPYLGQDFLSSE